MLRAFGHHVAMCCDISDVVKFENVQIFLQIYGCCMILYSFGQVHATMLRHGTRTSYINFVTPNMSHQCGPNERNVLLSNTGPTMLRYVALKCCERLTRLANTRPTILRYVALKCCDRLAGALEGWAI